MTKDQDKIVELLKSIIKDIDDGKIPFEEGKKIAMAELHAEREKLKNELEKINGSSQS